MNKKDVLATSLGNIIEWFDFGLFIFMAPLIGAQFFPHQTGDAATLDALLVFAVGFIFRPLGGIFFGHFGDTRGRAQPLRLALLIITLSTSLVGMIPSYEKIGFLAPVLFTGLRLMQGLSIGGEYSGAIIYLAESAPNKQRGFITSFAATGANLGFLLATLSFLLLNQFVTPKALQDWAWRLPFLFTGIPGSIIIYYRFKLSETPIYSQLEKKQALQTQPFFTAINDAPYSLLKILGLTCMSSTFYYVFFGYMPTYLEHYIGFSLKQALTIQTLLIVLMLFLVPLAGLCGDYFSRKSLLIFTALSIMITIIPCFYLLQMNSLLTTILALTTATLLSSLDQGNSLTAVVENCPESIRYSGIAFSYNLGMAVFGGTAPLIVTLLSEKVSLLAPAYYLFIMAGISLIAATTILSGNKQLVKIQR